MVISCCAAIRQCRMVKDAGFDRVVLSATELAGSPGERIDQLRRQLRRWNLDCRCLNDFCPPELKLCGPGYRPEQVAGYVERLARRAAGLEITRVGVGAPLSRMLPEGYPGELAEEQLRECMELTAVLCRPYGIGVSLEPICRQMTNFLNHTDETFRLAASCGGLGMVYDIYHAWMMEEPPEAVLGAMEKVDMVHLAHADRGRKVPGKDTVKRYFPYVQTLLTAGYRGEISVEAPLDGVDAAHLAECCRALRQMIDGCR